MTLGVTIVLVTAAFAAANGCTICVQHETSKFEHDCRERGGTVRTLGASHQHCVTDGGAAVALARDLDDGGGH